MCILVRALFAIFALGTYGVAHFSIIEETVALQKSGLAVWHSSILNFVKRSNCAGGSHVWLSSFAVNWIPTVISFVRPALPLTTELWNVRSGLLHRLVSLIATTLILRLPFTFVIPVLSSSDVLVYLLIDSMCSGCHSHCLAYVYKLGLIL